MFNHLENKVGLQVVGGFGSLYDDEPRDKISTQTTRVRPNLSTPTLYFYECTPVFMVRIHFDAH